MFTLLRARLTETGQIENCTAKTATGWRRTDYGAAGQVAPELTHD